MKRKGKLYLVPNFIGDESIARSFPQHNIEVIHSLSCFFVEKAKSARGFLKKLDHPVPLQGIEMREIPKQQHPGSYLEWLEPILHGKSAGLISEAGLPAVADPGEGIIRQAHELEIPVEPLVGPSSIFLALAASGLNGQSFCFHGYLPIDKKLRVKKIKFLENLSRQQQQTHIFMETPYRNEQLLKDVFKSCSPNTLFCIARDVNSKNEWIKTRTIGEWRNARFDVHKKPAIFLLNANA